MISRMTKLTTCFIETIEQPGKYYDIHGLFLRVYPAGSKNWYQRLTINGRRHEFGLGNANIKSLSKVRKEAFKNFKDSKKVKNNVRKHQQRDKNLTTKEMPSVVTKSNHVNWGNDFKIRNTGWRI